MAAFEPPPLLPPRPTAEFNPPPLLPPRPPEALPPPPLPSRPAMIMEEPKKILGMTMPVFIGVVVAVILVVIIGIVFITYYSASSDSTKTGSSYTPPPNAIWRRSKF